MPKEQAITGPLFAEFSTENSSIRFTDAGQGMLVIQSPATNREALVLHNHEVRKLHNLLAGMLGK